MGVLSRKPEQKIKVARGVIVSAHLNHFKKVRGVFRTLWNISHEAFCVDTKRLKDADYFCKTFRLKCLTGLWICLCKLNSWKMVLWKFLLFAYFIWFSANVFHGSIPAGIYLFKIKNENNSVCFLNSVSMKVTWTVKLTLWTLWHCQNRKKVIIGFHC